MPRQSRDTRVLAVLQNLTQLTVSIPLVEESHRQVGSPGSPAGIDVYLVLECSKQVAQLFGV